MHIKFVTLKHHHLNTLLRFICKKELNIENNDCADFEARFCCQSSSMNTKTCLNNVTNIATTSAPTEKPTTISSSEPLSYLELEPPESFDDLRNFKIAILLLF